MSGRSAGADLQRLSAGTLTLEHNRLAGDTLQKIELMEIGLTIEVVGMEMGELCLLVRHEGLEFSHRMILLNLDRETEGKPQSVQAR